MEKNWLIRTRSNKILGPISKAKLIEFINKGSLVGEDEVVSGNGYWFKIREKDLLDKYVFGDVPQTFNPISEAENVLTAHSLKRETTASFKPSGLPQEVKEKSKSYTTDEGELIPSDDDLAYPDMDNLTFDESEEVDDITKVSMSFDPKMLQSPGEVKKEEAKVELAEIDLSDENVLIPDDDDLAYPDLGVSTSEVDNEVPTFEVDIPVEKVQEESSKESVSPKRNLPKESPIKLNQPKTEAAQKNLEDLKVSKKEPPKKKKKGSKAAKENGPKKSYRNDFILIILLLSLVFAAFYGVFYYWTKVLRKDLPFISSVSAQEILSLDIKKKA